MLFIAFLLKNYGLIKLCYDFAVQGQVLQHATDKKWKSGIYVQPTLFSACNIMAWCIPEQLLQYKWVGFEL